ncbi:MAG: UDP-N-acetylmuramate dehydrogenase [Oscillospiraceae bacterium]|nr:UDP-N-acetylmuramate dehydrogenase [Oscillospiraceae bacterium]
MIELTCLQQHFTEQGSDIPCRFNEPLSEHTSFRIGGNAEIMAFPENSEQLQKLLLMSAELDTKPVILGAGTNVLAPDEGVSGIVICLKDALDGIEVLDGHRIRCMAGVTMTRAAVFAANNGLTGLEFAHGIPGTVGGGIYMNAGAYGGEISGVCECVQVMDPQGNIRTLDKAALNFSYRHSMLNNSSDVIISAVFQLEPGIVSDIRGKMKELMTKRSASQPLDMPSAGSAFKRPVGHYAAALIDQAGLKGLRVGGAEVSRKHAGFIVNCDNASANDVKELIRQVRERVWSDCGVWLDPEIRIW